MLFNVELGWKSKAILWRSVRHDLNVRRLGAGAQCCEHMQLALSWSSWPDLVGARGVGEGLGS